MDRNVMKLSGNDVNRRAGGIPLAVGQAASKAEETALGLGTNRIYWFRVRHPFVYGWAAFLIGGGIVALFTMTTYKNWSYEGVNLVAAFYEVVLGGLGGGIAAVLLAFAYTRSIRPTLAPMKADHVIATENQPPRRLAQAGDEQDTDDKPSGAGCGGRFGAEGDNQRRGTARGTGRVQHALQHGRHQLRQDQPPARGQASAGCQP